MKKVIILGLVLLMVVVFAITVCGKAQKLDLIDNSGYSNVAIQDPQGDDVVGFVIFNNPDPEDENDDCNLVVVVSLKNGEPDTDYNIFLECWIDGSRDHVYIIGGSIPRYDSGNYPLHTNENGKGNFELRLVTGDLVCLVGNHSYAKDYPSGLCKLQIVATKTSVWNDFVSTAVDIVVK